MWVEVEPPRAVMSMWDKLTKYFQRYPAQSRVAQTLLKHGLAVREDGVYAGDIAIADTALAKATDVDRRIIKSTVETILREKELRDVYWNLQPTGLLKDAAPALRWGVIEIVPDDPQQPGILAHVARLISDRGISIRQAIVDDPELVEEPRLYVVTEGPLPMDLVGEIKEGPGVGRVVIY